MDKRLSELFDCVGFEWDESNTIKIWARHKVSRIECEQAFFNQPLTVSDDVKHSQTE